MPNVLFFITFKSELFSFLMSEDSEKNICFIMKNFWKENADTLLFILSFLHSTFFHKGEPLYGKNIIAL